MNSIQLVFGASNALAKWLKVDLPRLPAQHGKQTGVNTLKSDSTTMYWQAHIIDNQYKSYEKTIIVCEANSRFIFLIPVTARLTIDELTQLLAMEWQSMLAETLASYQLIPRNEIPLLLNELSNITFNASWVKNTDLSINGHISDAGLWVEQILREQSLSRLSVTQLSELAIYLNTSIKRVTNRQTKRKEKFIPTERLLAYLNELVKCSELATNASATDRLDNVICFTTYKQNKQ